MKNHFQDLKPNQGTATCVQLDVRIAMDQGLLCASHFPIFKEKYQGFPGGTVVKNLPANEGDTGSSPGLGRSHMLRSN